MMREKMLAYGWRVASLVFVCACGRSQHYFMAFWCGSSVISGGEREREEAGAEMTLARREARAGWGDGEEGGRRKRMVYFVGLEERDNGLDYSRCSEREKLEKEGEFLHKRKEKEGERDR